MRRGFNLSSLIDTAHALSLLYKTLECLVKVIRMCVRWTDNKTHVWIVDNYKPHLIANLLHIWKCRKRLVLLLTTHRCVVHLMQFYLFNDGRMGVCGSCMCILRRCDCIMYQSILCKVRTIAASSTIYRKNFGKNYAFLWIHSEYAPMRLSSTRHGLIPRLSW